MAFIKTIKKFKTAIRKNLFLSEKTKKFWISKADDMPLIILRLVYKQVQKNNALIEKYIKAALNEDKNGKYLSELKNKVKNLKSNILKSVEKEKSNDADKILADQLMDI